MIKQSLYFSNPYYLKTMDNQLVIVSKVDGKQFRRPIEDIGFLILDNPRLELTQNATQKLLENNVAIIHCNAKHLPTSISMPLYSHLEMGKRVRLQISMSKIQKKQIWKKIIQTKIFNQATLLEKINVNSTPLKRWKSEVLSGDSSNREALASRYYWRHLFSEYTDSFKRDRYGFPPNNLLNFGYTILRAATARALIGSGLFPLIGVHHKNKYNPMPLADDVMEIFRPFVDEIVLDILKNEGGIPDILTSKHRIRLIKLLASDSISKQGMSPIMIALKKTCAQIALFLDGQTKELFFPKLPKKTIWSLD